MEIKSPRPLSALQAALSMIKCSVGAGSFALPYAFAHTGILLSLCLTCIMAAVSAYSIHLLLEVEVSMRDLGTCVCIYVLAFVWKSN